MVERTVASDAAYEGLHHGSSYLEHVDFVAAIREGLPPKVTFRDGLVALAVGVAAHQVHDAEVHPGGDRIVEPLP